VGTVTVTDLDPTEFTYAALNLNNIDTLLIQNAEGTENRYWLMDNLDYTTCPVPLPPSVILMGSGLLGLIYLRRRI
jgi:hypothetical protein